MKSKQRPGIHSVIGVFVLVCAAGFVLGSPVRAGEVPNSQYTNIAPLPGAAVAIDSEGKLDGLGAVQINIPIAYTPGWGYANLGHYQGGHPSSEEAGSFDNGSSIVALGFFGSPRIYASGMQVSKLWSEAKAVSAQISVLDEEAGRPAVAVGMQDILRKEPDGRSPYITATKSLILSGRNSYATIGFGGGRFLHHPFGGVSVAINEYLNAATEWDGFQLNNGVVWRPGGRDGKFNMLLSYNGQTGVLVGANLAYDFNR